MTDTLENPTTTYLHNSLGDALFSIRQEVGPLTRDAENPHFNSKFTSLPTLVEKVDPIAWKHGVFIRHQVNLDVLRHELWFNGEMVEVYDLVLPNPQGTAQGLGSSLTYMRRYDYTTTLGLVVDLDDDGNEASKRPAASTVTRNPPVVPAAPVAAKAEAIASSHASQERQTVDASF